MTEQLTLFNLAPTQTIKTVHDPYWDEIVLSPGTVENNGQTSLFYDDSTEPPDPDDYSTPQQYERAWNEWEKKFPHLVAETQVMSVREQAIQATPNTDVREQLKTNQVAPEHTHWIEEYWVKRCGKKHYYYRYCWMEGRKINRCHLGSLRSHQGREKKQAVEFAIADGQTPQEIKLMLRGNHD
ncbi:hypothetical protein NIES21_15320 [Anabaenopsis circularis NIES-21]|uniref:C-5 cytosine-specific DNA methylase n=1 Tax=Anabaenopsis circularis NIES-21 TaxID=1085406 RepID=A0A1Z4GDV9_9CYAN|nr:hypothetical protein NIES21_15320 [Anabaenopsis circularis NIES-21]